MIPLSHLPFTTRLAVAILQVDNQCAKAMGRESSGLPVAEVQEVIVDKLKAEVAQIVEAVTRFKGPGGDSPEEAERRDEIVAAIRGLYKTAEPVVEEAPHA